MPRRARLDAPGILHHVILRAIEKRRIVRDVADRKNFIKRLRENVCRYRHQHLCLDPDGQPSHTFAQFRVIENYDVRKRYILP